MNITAKKLEKTKKLLELLNDYHNYLNMFDANTYDKLADLANKLEKELDWELSYLEKEVEANQIQESDLGLDMALDYKLNKWGF